MVVIADLFATTHNIINDISTFWINGFSSYGSGRENEPDEFEKLREEFAKREINQ